MEDKLQSIWQEFQQRSKEKRVKFSHQLEQTFTSQHDAFLSEVQNEFEAMLESLARAQLSNVLDKAKQVEGSTDQEEEETNQLRERITRTHYEAQRGQVRLDVGGKYYSTSVSNLTKYSGSMLAAMFSGRHQVVKDEKGRVFIDRDGKLFRYILDFLRNDEWDLPNNDPYLLRKILQEIDFYGLPPPGSANTSPTTLAMTTIAGSDLTRTAEFEVKGKRQLIMDYPRGYEFQVSKVASLRKVEVELILPPTSTVRAFLCENGAIAQTTAHVGGNERQWYSLSFNTSATSSAVSCNPGKVYAIFVELTGGGAYIYVKRDSQKRNVDEVVTGVACKYWGADSAVHPNTFAINLKLVYETGIDPTKLFNSMYM